MATAELAVAMPVAVLVLAIVLGALSLGIDEVRCVDAARAGARSAARGDPLPTVRAEAGRSAPVGARVAVRVGGGRVRVTVTSRGKGVLRLLGATVTPSATAESAAELDGGRAP